MLTNEIWIASLAVAIGTFFGFFFIKILKEQKEKRIEKEKSFVNTMILAIQNNNIKDEEDVTTIFRGVLEIENLNFSKSHLIFLLEKVILNLYKQEQDNKLQERMAFFKSILSKMKTELLEHEPFTGLPKVEKTLMTDILEFGKTQQEKLFINKLQDLSQVIKTRYEENQKLEETNKWSVPLSIIGILVSIGFGLYTIFSS